MGGGPAGAMTSLAASRAGLSVLLVERDLMPRYKVCGCCLNPATLALLRSAGLDLGARQLGVELEGVQVAGWGHVVRLCLPGGRALSRARLDDELVTLARDSGVRLVGGIRAEVGKRLDRARSVVLAAPGGPVVVTAGVVVVATGLPDAGSEGGWRSRRAGDSRIGLGCVLRSGGADYAMRTVYMAAGQHGYVGLVRLRDGALNIGCSVRVAALREHGSAARLVDVILEQAGQPPLGPARGWRGTAPLRGRRPVLAGERVVRVGDSAGFWEPFTGEGIGWALEAGQRTGVALGRLLPAWRPEAVRRWSRAQTAWMARRQRRSRVVATLAGSAPLARGALAFAAARPAWLEQLLPGGGSTRVDGRHQTHHTFTTGC